MGLHCLPRPICPKNSDLSVQKTQDHRLVLLMKIVPTKLKKKNRPELTLNYKDKLLNKKQNSTYKMPANDKNVMLHL